MMDKIYVFIEELYDVFLVVKIGINGVGVERCNSTALVG
jgi:hypothetical protein